MILCKIAIDVGNSNCTIATALYEVSKDGSRHRIPGSVRLWGDREAIQRNSVLIPSVILYAKKNPGQISEDYYGYGALDMIKQNHTKLTVSEKIKHRIFVEGNYGDNAEDYANLIKYLINCVHFGDNDQPDACEVWVSHPTNIERNCFFYFKKILNDALCDYPIPIWDIYFISEAECIFNYSVTDGYVASTLINRLHEQGDAVALMCDIGGKSLNLSLYRIIKPLGMPLHTFHISRRELGGSFVDEYLFDKLNDLELLDSNSVQEISPELLIPHWITPFKEYLNEQICREMDGRLDFLRDIAIEEKIIESKTINKQTFAQWCNSYVEDVCEQIKDFVLQSGISNPEKIDLAVLTGGGCKLYPIESAIQEILRPQNKEDVCVLSPNNLSNILDGVIAENDHPDYFNGLYPKRDICSLSCVLGNLANELIDQGHLAGFGNWWLNKHGNLYIYGNGNMPDWDFDCHSPWYKSEKINTVHLLGEITSIGDYAFVCCNCLREIILLNGITKIGVNSFDSCTGLRRITIPNSVVEIGSAAFTGCSALNEVPIPDSVTKIDSGAFWGCKNIHRINIPWNITEIDDGVFYGCTGLKDIIIPHGVTKIGSDAFYECTGLKYISIPDSVDEIGERAFYGCSALHEISIPSRVTKISFATFCRCRSLRKMNIPYGVITIGQCAFCECYELIHVTIPESVTKIENRAFYRCSRLRSIAIPDSVTEIEEQAFFDCLSLYTIPISNRISKINYATFCGCRNLSEINIPDSVTEIGESAFCNCTGLIQVTIPNSVAAIGSRAFYNCTELQHIIIPNSIAKIGTDVFEGCSKLQKEKQHMIICKIAIDVANNNSAIATALYELSADGNRKKIPKTSRLWADRGAMQRNSALIPSVILYEEKNPGKISRDCYGYDALEIIKQAESLLAVNQNIKYRLFVKDDPYGDNTEDFTNLAKYLLGCIHYDNIKPDAYEIFVSHPVVCDEDNLFHLENIINDALNSYSMQSHGIHFINEAECAFRFALSDKKVQTAVYNTLTVKNNAIALVCDIGGSTMELSLYRFTRDGQKVQYTSAGILRADEDAGRGLGSYKMDQSLRNKLNGMGLLNQNKLTEIPESVQMLRWIKPLKEELNNRLRKGKIGSLNSLHAIAMPGKLMQNDTVDKQQFEHWCSGYTAAICKQIKNLAKQAGITPEEIDMAILTGGGCELYPIETAIRELLKPGSGSKACVLRPNDPSGILDGRIIKENNPDYYNGLCPKEELSSLACVLGNLAEDLELKIPINEPTPNRGSSNREDKLPKENVYQKRYSNFRPCPNDGFVAFWFKECENKGYSCNSYCECDSVCTKYTCSCVSECHCYSNCRCDDDDYYSCLCEREYG